MSSNLSRESILRAWKVLRRKKTNVPKKTADYMKEISLDKLDNTCSVCGVNSSMGGTDICQWCAFFDVLTLDRLVELKKIIDNKIDSLSPKRITILLIQSVVCSHYNTELKDLFTERGSEDILKAKHIAMYFCKKYCKDRGKEISLKKIAKGFKKKVHTTILHAIKSVNNQIETNKEFAKEINKIDNKIKKQLINEI